MSRSSQLRVERWARHVSRSAAFLAALLFLRVDATTLGAQATEGAALFLLQPVGARTVGRGEASVADTLLGTEALWWNAAGMARNRKREVAAHAGTAFGATTTLVAGTVPSRALGTIGVGAYMLAYPDQEATDEFENPDGILTSRYYVLSAAYATPMGKRFSAGITAKEIFIRIRCNGCIDNRFDQISNVGAFDVGAQYILPSKLPVTLGASIRNMGLKLPAKDALQADALPRTYQVGARARVALAALARRETTLDVMSDLLVSPEGYDSPSMRFGAELSYRDIYTLRGGYKGLSKIDGVERGLTAGVGFKYNNMQFDIARRFDSSGQIAESTAPTFVSLRFVF